MNEYTIVLKMIDKIWTTPLSSEVLNKKLDVSLYNSLNTASKIKTGYIVMKKMFFSIKSE